MKIKWVSGTGWRRWPPHSLGGLVLLSFTLVVLPLLLVVLGAAYAVNRIAGQSENIVYEAVQLTQGSLLLMEELVTMERSARQYLVVGDPGLLQVFRSSHQQFDHTVHGLMALPLGGGCSRRSRDCRSARASWPIVFCKGCKVSQPFRLDSVVSTV
ncbi:hypothetical protein BI364_14245 [Acidihalobacter yilgarnensis]|uniref:CHASE3 domain-containing protein n=1 Tax=Acidihalobacter yilgarnensis TaxID=2819280 RepID=A0A1D8IR40_9GAMM|nr:hypothetical protein [Acidihalobacter yilgarnensis]AOU98959.1 hypothetical protein BI364_14245 [Acidihalobacter yilgarnensis]